MLASGGGGVRSGANSDDSFMYRRGILRTFHIAVDFEIVLYEGLGRGRGGPFEGVGPENHIKLTTQNTEYRMQTT
jgi:hypothetical protein